MNSNQILREHLLELLRGGGAHCEFERATSGLDASLRGRHPRGMLHTPWRLVEHMRIAQWDILEFCRNPAHVSPDFPEGYWPASDAPPTRQAWSRSIRAFQEDARAIQALVADPQVDLHAPIPHGAGQTILREALLVADHNAYHIGQLVIIRRALGDWPE